jgi:hypothetical protein
VTRCLNCNCILRSDETSCYSCSAVAPVDPGKPTTQTRIASVVTILFLLSLPLLVASFVTDVTPPAPICVGVSLILMLVRSSARQMSDSGTR